MRPPPTSADVALRSVHTSNLPEIFKQLRISLAGSTYQAGTVIVIRNDQGIVRNTHFRPFAWWRNRERNPKGSPNPVTEGNG